MKSGVSLGELREMPNRYSHYLFAQNVWSQINERKNQKKIIAQQHNNIAGVGAIHALADEGKEDDNSQEKKENG